MHSLTVSLVLAICLGVSLGEEIPEPNLEKNLAVARQIGLPTSLAEFKQSLPQVSEDENGANLYQEILGRGRNSYRFLTPVPEGQFDLQKWREFEKANAPELTKIERLAEYDFMLLERNWEDGVGVSYPELTVYRNWVNVMSKLAYISSANGDHMQALARFRVADRLIRQLKHIPGVVAGVVHSSMTSILVNQIMASAYQSNDPRYEWFLIKTMKDTAVPNWKSIYQFQIVEMFESIEISKLPKGYERFGMSESEAEIPPAGLAVAELRMSQGNVKADIVAGVVEKVRSTRLPLEQQRIAISNANFKIMSSLLAYPFVAKVLELPLEDDTEFKISYFSKEMEVVTEAFRKCLHQAPGNTPEPLNDLIIPISNVPIKAWTDDKQSLHLEVQRFDRDEPRVFTFSRV